MIIWDVPYQEAVQIIESQFTDGYGLPVQGDRDRGDSASRVGIIYTLRYMNEGMSEELKYKFNHALNQIEITPTTYVRHPDGFSPYPDGSLPQDYIADVSRFSRDQEEEIKIAMGFYPEQHDRLLRLYEKREKDGFHYQNKDIHGPANIGTYLRGIGHSISYLLLTFTDIDLLANAIIRTISRKINPIETSNDLVLSMMFLQAEKRTPTITSWIAKQIYKLSNPIQALDWYFNKDIGHAPPINILFHKPMKDAGF
jgi:hypothetical protein